MATNIAWIGRLTGPKGEIAYRIITEVAPLFPQQHFTIVGGPVTERYQKATGSNVTLTGFVDDVKKIFSANELIIGAGRVPVEAMRHGLPVIAVGENRYIGPIDANTISDAKATNFGDCDQLQPWQTQQLVDDLRALVTGERMLPVAEYETYVADYRLDVVYPKVMNVYRQALMDNWLQCFKEIPVLTYHRVLREKPEGSKFNIYVTVAELEWQIQSLKQRGVDFITFKDIADGVRVKKPVILTFDDGYEDNYQNLLPLLQKHNAKAVIYALGDRTIKNNYWDIAKGEPEARLMSDEYLLACHASGLIEIGAHGLTHRRLSQLNGDEAQHEISESKSALEKLLGSEVVSFAYPYGDYGVRETELVRQVGYLFGVATVTGPVKMADDLMRVRRITMFPNAKMAGFRKKTSGWYLRYCKLKGKDF
jgi:peptidoglycan/xylan/chitin deacetylase (PgdA/CDA1 family)